MSFEEVVYGQDAICGHVIMLCFTCGLRAPLQAKFCAAAIHAASEGKPGPETQRAAF